MKKGFILFFILAFLLSCDRNEKNLFIGDWYRLDEYIVVDSFNVEKIDSGTLPRPQNYYPTGISFIGKDSVKYFGGIWKNHGESFKYLGEDGTFQIIKDSIKFYRPNESIPVKQRKFEFATLDTLKFYKNDTCSTFIKFETAIKKYYHLDSIKILEANGWGPDREYFISSTGQIRYFDEGWDYDSVLRRGEISRSIFVSIEHRYNWANFMELGDYLCGNDGRELETQFYSNGKLVKTIKDHENSAPMRLIWANSLLINNVKSELEYPTD